jgi:hypothetical protein
MLVSMASNAQDSKSFKLEFYNSDEFENYATISAAAKPLLKPASFVCELVNVFDPDMKYEIVKFDFTIKSKGGEQKYTDMSEAALLDKIKQTESLPDGSIAATITVTKVFYVDSKKTEKSMDISKYDYAEILIY